jgi:hypothetical protein
MVACALRHGVGKWLGNSIRKAVPDDDCIHKSKVWATPLSMSELVNPLTQCCEAIIENGKDAPESVQP